MIADRPRRLRRSNNRIIAGICGGFAEWVDWDPTVARLLYVLFSIMSVAFPGVIVYVVLWLVMPKAEEPAPGG